MILRREVLPQPDGPTTQTKSLSRRVKPTRSRAVTDPPVPRYSIETSSISRTGGPPMAGNSEGGYAPLPNLPPALPRTGLRRRSRRSKRNTSPSPIGLMASRPIYSDRLLPDGFLEIRGIDRLLEGGLGGGGLDRLLRDEKVGRVLENLGELSALGRRAEVGIGQLLPSGHPDQRAHLPLGLLRRDRERLRHRGGGVLGILHPELHALGLDLQILDHQVRILLGEGLAHDGHVAGEVPLLRHLAARQDDLAVGVHHLLQRRLPDIAGVEVAPLQAASMSGGCMSRIFTFAGSTLKTFRAPSRL